MSDLRKRFEKETGKTVGEIGIYECDNCGNDQLEIETWDDNYVFWLENLANGVDESTEPALHKHIVSNNEVAVCDCPLSFRKYPDEWSNKERCSRCGKVF